VSGSIFIGMSEKKPIDDNAYDTAIAGNSGAVSTAPGWGTHFSPDVSQNSANFASSNANQELGTDTSVAVNSPASPEKNDAAVDQIYSKPVTPSPDEVITGLKHELHLMTKKDKARAKEIVLANLRKDPHFYGKLGMMNINDKEMMKNDQPVNKSEEQMNERIKLLNQMLEAKGKKEPTPQSILDALKETKAKRDARYSR
jgi:hypothetical protein